MSAGTDTQPNEMQVFRIYIKATPEAIFEAITSADWSLRYGYRGRNEFELIPGGKYEGHATKEMLDFGAPEIMVDGQVIECDPPKKFVHTFHANFTPETIAEPGVIVTYLLEPENDALTKLTVTHDVNGSPVTAASLGGHEGPLAEGGGGFPFVLSDLKSLLESGVSLAD